MDESVEQYMTGQNLDWSRLGYVQLVREHVELCSAVMLLSDLHRMKSPAKRILMFPRLWLQQTEEAKKEKWNPELSTTWRLLKNAARRYNVQLIPMETIVDGADGEIVFHDESVNMQLTDKGALPSSYSLASLYSLIDYERIIYLQGPGVLLDASALDSLLAFSKSEPMAAYPATPERTDLSTSLLLIRPSQENFQQLKRLRTSNPTSDLDLFRKTFAAPNSLISEWSLSMGNVVYESQRLRDASDGFNATEFEQATTFVRLTDPGLPGPEYDVPFWDRARVRPKNEQAKEAWGRLYERFRQRRMEVCGLDLEVYQPVVVSGVDETNEVADEV